MIIEKIIELKGHNLILSKPGYIKIYGHRGAGEDLHKNTFKVKYLFEIEHKWKDVFDNLLTFTE